MSTEDDPICIAMTGASGACYGLTLLQELVSLGKEVYFLISKAGLLVVNSETDISLPAKTQAIESSLTELTSAQPGQITVFGLEQWSAPVASGTGRCGGMVVCPASMGAVARIAQGLSGNVLERAADVMLKERKPLILVPRETPYSTIHLKNLLQLAEAGATILDANPAYYHRPETLNDIAEFVTARILDQLRITHNLGPRWGDNKNS